jgi:hypothetical protein
VRRLLDRSGRSSPRAGELIQGRDSRVRNRGSDLIRGRDSRVRDRGGDLIRGRDSGVRDGERRLGDRVRDGRIADRLRDGRRGFDGRRRDWWDWRRGRYYDWGRRNRFWFGLSFGYPYYGYGSFWPYWSDPYWYHYGSYFSLWWYPRSYFWLGYGDPYWYGDYYYDPYPYGYSVYYGDWYSPTTGYVELGPNSYVYGPLDDRTQAPEPDLAAGERYLQDAVSAFRSGDYEEALRLAQHATLEMPDNGALLLFLAQAQFATGKYLGAAETLHRAFNMLPDDQLGTFVQNYREYYGSIGDYTRQLRDLEALLKKEPTAPFGPFLLGYHYGFLGYNEYAVGQLEKAVELTQTDEQAQRLLDIFSARIKPSAAQLP